MIGSLSGLQNNKALSFLPGLHIGGDIGGEFVVFETFEMVGGIIVFVGRGRKLLFSGGSFLQNRLVVLDLGRQARLTDPVVAYLGVDLRDLALDDRIVVFRIDWRRRLLRLICGICLLDVLLQLLDLCRFGDHIGITRTISRSKLVHFLL